MMQAPMRSYRDDLPNLSAVAISHGSWHGGNYIKSDCGWEGNILIGSTVLVYCCQSANGDPEMALEHGQREIDGDEGEAPKSPNKVPCSSPFWHRGLVVKET